MANKNQSKNLKKSLKTIHQINWFDGINQLPDDINITLLNQCSDIIEQFINSDQLMPRETTKSNAKIRKQKASKGKVTKSIKNSRKTKAKVKKSQGNIQSFDHTNLSSANNYPYYPSSFPCFRSCGPINCPKNKLPMPRDLWYRIVYSQALEQQLGSGEGFTHQIQSGLQSSSKRKHQEDESPTENLYNNNNPQRRQTTNAVVPSISTSIAKLDTNIGDYLHQSEWNYENTQLQSLDFCVVPSDSDKLSPTDNLAYIDGNLPLEIEYKPSETNLIHEENKSNERLETSLSKTNRDQKILSSQSADAGLIKRPKMYHGQSMNAIFARIHSIPVLPQSTFVHNQSNLEEITASSHQPQTSNMSIQQSIIKNTDNNSLIDSPDVSQHPIMNQLFEYYKLEDVPRNQLYKRLNRRLKHIRQTLEIMSSNELELKLKYKRNALVKKRQTPVQSLTKDERIAMVELELNVYEYVQALDEPSSKGFYVNTDDEQLSSTLPISLLHQIVSPVERPVMASGSAATSSVSTFSTVQPLPTNPSTALLSSITHFNENSEQTPSWNHPLISNLLTNFDHLTSTHKAQIHKQLLRRYEHISKKAKELNNSQLQAQIKSKSKALEQIKKILQPNSSDLLRMAELELCLFELHHERTQRNEID